MHLNMHLFDNGFSLEYTGYCGRGRLIEEARLEQ
jgi:hypothetical protein